MNSELSEANWFKSTYSQPQGECVEVAFLPDGLVGVRDSKSPTGPAHVFAPPAWDVFTEAVRSGAFDRP
ncbi:DUF397 domain-containing protein [Nocardia concava]|uniref:DUF397 domain-containing protein n=1 Tax=Nocardia concava TaxID=257281 RepID=UPI0002FFEBEC|nr:DUF397 domain-containing protein [Nocardia concava]